MTKVLTLQIDSCSQCPYCIEQGNGHVRWYCAWEGFPLVDLGRVPEFCELPEWIDADWREELEFGYDER